MSLEYTLTFAGVPFFEDNAPAYRMGPARGGTRAGGPESTTPTYRKGQVEQDVLAEVNRHLPPEYLRDFVPAGRPSGKYLSALAAGPNATPGAEVRVGDWYYPPTASRWSVFRGLATSSCVAAMLAATNQGADPADFVMLSGPVSPDNSDDNEDDYTLTTQMYMLPPRPLGETAGALDGLYLVTLVDERFYFQGTPVSLSPTVYTLWQDLLTELAGAAGVEVNLPAVPAAYGRPDADSQLWGRMESVAFLLDAVAYNLGMTVVRNLDGTYDLLSPADSYARLAANRGPAAEVSRLMGGNLFEGSSRLPVGDLTYARNPALPAVVNVAFPCYVYGDDPVPHLVNQRYRPQRPSCVWEDGFPTAYAIAVPLASCGLSAAPFFLPGDLAGVSEVTLRTTAKAVFPTEASVTEDDPDNLVGIAALAARVAADYVAQKAFALDEVYPGTPAWAPEGFHDLIWTYSARGKGARLRVMRGPFNDGATEFQHGTPATTGNDRLQTTAPPGVGGPSVAQTWRDSYSGSFHTTLARTLNSGDTAAFLNSVDYLPTQNRWRAEVAGQSGAEVVLFEGTSGGVNSGISSFRVDIALRAVDGTVTGDQANGSPVTMTAPGAAYGANLVTAEKGQFAYPAAVTSGGISEVTLPPVTQTVRVLDGAGTLVNGTRLYSGQVNLFNPDITPTAPAPVSYSGLDYVWAVERNGKTLSSGDWHAGQLAGYSKGTADATSGGGGTPVATAPVYLCEAGGGTTAKIQVQITSRTYPGGASFAAYSCQVVADGTSPNALTYTAGASGPTFYNLNDVDLPVGLVCWIFQSANGSWYLNDDDARVDVVQKTGTTPDANGLYDGTLYVYNHNTHALEARGTIKVLDITGP